MFEQEQKYPGTLYLEFWPYFSQASEAKAIIESMDKTIEEEEKLIKMVRMGMSKFSKSGW